MNQKGFTPIIIILLVILAVGGYFVYTNYSKNQTKVNTPQQTTQQPSAQDETANWKTYTDTNIGFSIQYPDNWIKKGNMLTVSNNCAPKDKDCEDSSITFSIGDKNVNQGLKDYILNLNITTERGEPQITNEKYMPSNIVKLGAIEANFMGMYGPINTYVTNDGIRILEISAFNVDSDTIYKILSTLKFTDQSSNADKIYNWIVATDQEKATWNTYTDSVNHFSIQYPKEWRQDKAYTEGEIVLTMDKPCKGCGGVGRGVYVKVRDNSNNLKSLEYVIKTIMRDNDYPNYPGFIYVIKNQPEYFAAFDATVIDGMSGAGSPGPTSYIKNKDNKIIILYSDGVENDVVSKIFSTFKFLN